MDQIKVFVSSTSRDLKEERNSVEMAIRRMDIPFIGMEYFGSSDESSLDLCMAKLKECSIYIGIIGFRYGSLIPKTTTSYTEKEYETASYLGIPRLIYIKSDDAKICIDDIEPIPENKEKLQAFKNRLLSSHVISYFSDAKQLAVMVATDLHKLLKDRPERLKIISETDNTLLPRIIIKRAEMALSDANRFLRNLNFLEEQEKISTKEAQEQAINFFENYQFRFDGEFSVFDSNRITVFHQMKYMVGRKFEFPDVEFEPVFSALNNNRSGGNIKWLDKLSSDRIAKSDAFYGDDVSKNDYIRINIAPFSFFEPWQWYILVEGHNEIHGLSKQEVEKIKLDFKNKGWVVLKEREWISGENIGLE